MPNPYPSPESYPPYTGQTYVAVHEQDLQGVDGGLYIKTMTTMHTHIDAAYSPPLVTVTDTYPAGTSWNPDAKYQIHRGNFGLVFVQNKTPPYQAFGNSGYPLAFATLAEAEAALAQCSSSNIAPKYKFWGRDPIKEIAQTIAAYKANSEEFAEADTAISTHLTSRAVTAANSFYGYYSAKLVNQDSNNQFVLGMSAASGGGQNTTYLANSLSVQQLQAAADASITAAQGVPIVVPFESPLISDSHASAVEAKNAGEIRDQQIRQTIASAGGVYRGVTEAYRYGYNWEGTSIMMGAYGQAAAAAQT